MRSSWAEKKCGLSFFTPTCCLPTLLSFGGPHFVVLSAGTCILCIAVSKVSRGAHYLSLSAGRRLSVSPSLLGPPMPRCQEMKRTENWEDGEKRRGCLTRKGWKRRVRSEGRTGQQGGNEVCLAYFGFSRLLCDANICTLPSKSQF